MMKLRIHSTRRRGVWLAPFALLPFVAGCSSSSDDDGPSSVAAGPAADAFLLSANEAPLQGQVDVLTPGLTLDTAFEVGGNQGIAYDRIGNLYHADDRDAPGTPGRIVVFSHSFDRAAFDAFDPDRDRVIGGVGTTSSGLVNPKGIHLEQSRGLIVVADHGAGDVKVFGSAAGAAAPPVATIATAAAPWDVAHDSDADRLFVALTNGTIAVFDDFAATGGAGGASRTIIPADDTGTPIASNLHGIAYSPDTDRLVVSDVGALTDPGDPGFDSDGALYVFFDASTADGLTIPSRRVEGASTLLGNPVDIAFDGASVVVAEKSTDQLLVFADILTATTVDRAPVSMQTVSNPESIVAFVEPEPLGEEVTDIDTTLTALSGIVAVSNPPLPTDPEFGSIQGFETDLSATTTSFATGLSVENIVFDRNGDAYVTFNDIDDEDGDPTSVAGILVIGRLANQRDGDGFDVARDRLILGPSVGLVSPEGLDITSTGELIVCDATPAAGKLAVFSSQADGDVAPLFEVTDFGDVARLPWAVDYDAVADRVFVACEDGTVAVWDDFMAEGLAVGGSTLGAPDRVIIPADAALSQVSVNLRGLVHDAAQNSLYLGDVGDPDVTTDGQLFRIEDAATADGLTTVASQIGGPNSLLGDPWSLAWDGANLYVAEHSADLILRFDDFRLLVDAFDAAPDAQIQMLSVDGIALLPATLAP